MYENKFSKNSKIKALAAIIQRIRYSMPILIEASQNGFKRTISFVFYDLKMIGADI